MTKRNIRSSKCKSRVEAYICLVRRLVDPLVNHLGTLTRGVSLGDTRPYLMHERIVRSKEESPLLVEREACSQVINNNCS